MHSVNMCVSSSAHAEMDSNLERSMVPVEALDKSQAKRCVAGYLYYLGRGSGYGSPPRPGGVARGWRGDSRGNPRGHHITHAHVDAFGEGKGSSYYYIPMRYAGPVAIYFSVLWL